MGQQSAKLGVAVNLEMADEALLEQQDKMDVQNVVPPPF